VTAKELKDSVNLDFSQVEQENFTQLIHPPSIFVGQLKEYQLKGLR